MNFTVHYENRNSLPFFAADNFRVQGTFLKGNEFLSPDRILLELKSLQSEDFIKEANGFFNLVFQTSDTLFAAVDCIRSLPLFYSVKDEDFYISDSAEWIADAINIKDFDELAETEFRCTGYVTGEDTLIPEIKQIQAGEYIKISKGEGKFTITKNNYFVFAHTEPEELFSKEEYMRQLDSAMDKCIDNLIRFASGRQIVIPLSGGRDSRFIAMKLLQKKYENILCYTYGSEEHSEALLSRCVADTLGLKWVFVKYGDGMPDFLYGTDTGLGYQRMNHNYASRPHLQDLFAVHELKRNNVVDSDCIFVPGHSGDFPAGSHIPSITFMKKLDKNILADAIYSKHYSLACNIPKKQVECLKNRIKYSLNTRECSLTSSEFADSFEKWDWRNRQAKFIVNSVRVYDFFGFSWWLPFWDRNFLEFWENVPLEYRYERVLYNEFVDSLSEKAGIPVRKTIKTKTYYALRRIPFLRKFKNLRDYYFSKFCCYNKRLLKKKRASSFLRTFFTENMMLKYCKCTNELNGILINLFFENFDRK